MLTIRLTRRGKKNQPFFRIVVIDKKRSSTGGRAVEELGYVNPLTKKNSINKERALHWLKVGAQASPRVYNLLVSEKVIDAKKINVLPKYKEPVKEAAADAGAAAAVVVATSGGADAKEEEAIAEAVEAADVAVDTGADASVGDSGAGASGGDGGGAN